MIIKGKNKMKIDEIQKLIDDTDYWDMRILGMNASFFGDNIELIIENDEESSWKISFLSCYKVSYETDADRRKIDHVSEMTRSQLGYYGQDITVSESDTEGFYKIELDLSIMLMQIECKEIKTEKIKNIK